MTQPKLGDLRVYDGRLGTWYGEAGWYIEELQQVGYDRCWEPIDGPFEDEAAAVAVLIAAKLEG